MRLFISGASGLLGGNLSYLASQAGHDVLAGFNEHPLHIAGCRGIGLDLVKGDLSPVISFKPHCIIHCAALTSVDICETNRALAWQVNVGATSRVAECARRASSRLIFISTDSVFDGKKAYHKEGERTVALNYYAKTKIEAERIVGRHKNHAVVRTNFYGFNIQQKHSFAEWLYAKLSAGDKTPAFTDFYFSPILANNLSDALLELAQNEFCGTLHVAGKGRMSKYEFAQLFAELFSFDSALLVPTKMSELGSLKAVRPSDCSLDVSKAERLLRTPLLGIRAGLELFKRLHEQGYRERLRGR
ncbi:MAG: SDR family oxidoreductase [Candidatus Micrarchaeota archaeon]|nr:SDR family oxidoreductase [Candidatus Micrarchaeota archaeon]